MKYSLQIPGIYLDVNLREPVEGVLGFLNGSQQYWIKDAKQRKTLLDFFQLFQSTQAQGPEQKDTPRAEVSDVWTRMTNALGIKPIVISPGSLTWIPVGKTSMGHVGLALAMFRLAETGELSRIAQCACGCGTWILTNRRRKLAPGEAHRWRYRSTDAFKANRARTARQNYIPADGDRKALARKRLQRKLRAATPKKADNNE